MKIFKKFLLVMMCCFAIFSFVACDSLFGDKTSGDGAGNQPPVENPPVENPPEEEKPEDKIDYTNYTTDFSIKVKNNTTKKLVAFKGAPSESNLLGGVPAGPGNEHGLKNDTALFNASSDFILFLITEEDYLNADDLTKLANHPFATIYAYYNKNAENNLIYEISGSLKQGEGTIILYNTSGFNVELRRDGIGGSVLGYASQNMAQTEFSVSYDDYLLFPVFRKFNAARNEIITVYPKYSGGKADGKACVSSFTLGLGETESTSQILRTSDWVGKDMVFSSGCAYLLIQNNHKQGMQFYDGGQIVYTSTGGKNINSNKSLMFQIDMPKKPGSQDEYLTSQTFSQFSVGTALSAETLPEFTFESDKIYTITITGNTVYDIELSDIEETGTIDFASM